MGRYANGQLTFLRQKNGLANDSVLAVHGDQEGSLWVGTREGLSLITDVKLPIFATADGLPEGMTHGVAPARNQGVWAATSRGDCPAG